MQEDAERVDVAEGRLDVGSREIGRLVAVVRLQPLDDDVEIGFVEAVQVHVDESAGIQLSIKHIY